MKFVSPSQLLGCPLFGSNSGLFTVPGFIVSLVGILKKRRKEKKRRKKEKIKRERKEEGIKQERRKERKKELKNNTIKNNKLLLKKILLLGSNWPSQFCWSS